MIGLGASAVASHRFWLPITTTAGTTSGCLNFQRDGNQVVYLLRPRMFSSRHRRSTSRQFTPIAASSKSGSAA